MGVVILATLWSAMVKALGTCQHWGTSNGDGLPGLPFGLPSTDCGTVPVDGPMALFGGGVGPSTVYDKTQKTMQLKGMGWGGGGVGWS